MQKALKYLTNKDVIPVWSNVPFIIPAVIAASKGLFLYAALIIIAAAVSYYYHHTDETELKTIDRILAYSVIAANLYVLYLANFRQPYFAIALMFVAIAFYFFFTGKDHKYDTYHGMWHLSSVIITLMCVLAY